MYQAIQQKLKRQIFQEFRSEKNFRENMVGLSDHTSDIVSSLSASANNVVAIEKHFKLKKTKSVDSQFSIDPDGLRNLRDYRKKYFYH